MHELGSDCFKVHEYLFMHFFYALLYFLLKKCTQNDALFINSYKLQIQQTFMVRKWRAFGCTARENLSK
ncbi:hypothetical protein AZH43_04950 [Acinetobacter pragensis]|uniref:Uncharacterized protein n=1 Tax=Acinetobacter pragensis TaxID=1806892 RepID=A0A151XX79_9GAMM|nr:hypothetical protein AZH43_04950 [Acinetobacter pragensis]